MKRTIVIGFAAALTALCLAAGCGSAPEAQEPQEPERLPTGLAVESVSASEMQIVADDVLGWDVGSVARELALQIELLNGTAPQVVSDEAPESAREIILCSGAVNRELPFEPGEVRYGVWDGKLWIYGPTEAEFQYAYGQFYDQYLTGGSVNLTEADRTEDFIDWQETVLTPKGGDLAAALADAQSLLDGACETDPVHVIVELADGIYELPGGAGIQAGDFARFTLRGAEGADAVIDGTETLDWADFSLSEGGRYYTLQLEPDEDGVYPVFRDFYVDGRRVDVASTPIYKDSRGTDSWARNGEEEFSGMYVNAAMLEGVEDADGMEITIYIQWEFVRLNCTGLDWSDTRENPTTKWVRALVEQEELNDMVALAHRELSLSNRENYLSNLPAFLTPGTFCYNAHTGVLCYMPEAGEVPQRLGFSRTDTLLRLDGASGVTVENVTFTGTACTQTVTEGFLSFQACHDKRTGVPDCAAIELRNCEDVTISGCRFAQLGGHGILSRDRMNGLTIRDCRFDTVAMSAIHLGNHGTEWEETDCNYAILIENNDIRNIAREYPSAPALFVTHCDGLRILHNTISNTAYSAMSLGWGWTPVDWGYAERINLRRAEVAWNDIRDYMQVLKDGGGIYTLGANCTEEYTEYFNTIHDNYLEREFDNSFFHAGYYLDGASSNWHLYDNVCVGNWHPLYIQNIEAQRTHNDFCERLYTTTTVDGGVKAAKVNVLVEDTFYKDGIEKLYEEYPEAQAIEEAAGCRLD